MGKKLAILIIALVSMLIVSACAPEKEQIPKVIIEKSDQFIQSRVGEQFFNKYMMLNLERSSYNPKNAQNLLVYTFKIPEKPYIDELIDIPLDSSGNINLDRVEVPDCVNNPTECEFPIDEVGAIQIAKDAGLEEGISPWKTSFHWFGGDLNTYVWTVSNTVSESGSGQSYESSGYTTVIDANDGQILETSQRRSIA